jgi:hypothetical protein
MVDCASTEDDTVAALYPDGRFTPFNIFHPLQYPFNIEPEV